VATILKISSVVKRLLWRASPIWRGGPDFIQGRWLARSCQCHPPPLTPEMA